MGSGRTAPPLPGDATDRRLAAAATVADLREIARRRVPRAVFDYTDGAAEGEVSLRRARQAFRDIEFHPDILRPAASVDTSVEILGGPSALPFGIAPTGFTRFMHAEGEDAGAAAASSGEQTSRETRDRGGIRTWRILSQRSGPPRLIGTAP